MTTFYAFSTPYRLHEKTISGGVVSTTNASHTRLRTIFHPPHARRAEECFDEREDGRGGVCTFQIVNGYAARDFGESLLSIRPLIRSSANTTTTVAVVYDRGDPVVKTSRIRDLARAYDASGQHVYKGVVDDTSGQRLRSCVYNFTMHSMLSRFDDVHANKWWMNELTCRLADFVTTGVPIAARSATAKDEGGDQICQLDCTESTCVFNRTTTSVSCTRR